MVTAFRKAVFFLFVISLSASLSLAQGRAPYDDTHNQVSAGYPSQAGGRLEPGLPEYDPHSLVVSLTETAAQDSNLRNNFHGRLSTGLASLDRLVERYGVQVMQAYAPQAMSGSAKAQSRILRLSLPEGVDPLEAAAEFQNDPHVEIAEPNYLYRSTYIPNDLDFSNQWALHNIGLTGTPDADIDAPEAWDIQRGSPDIVIAVIDTGVYWQHNDLQSNIWNNPKEIPDNFIDDDHNGYVDDVIGWDFVTAIHVYPGDDGFPEDNDPDDLDGHGTHVAGIAAAVGDNNLHIVGVCMRCKIMALRASYKEPSTGRSVLQLYDIVRAIYYAADNGAHIINMSFGSWDDSLIQKEALEYASEKGLVLVAAAGNSNSDSLFYPAAYENVISVAATDRFDQRSIWYSPYASNHGYSVDLAAPGSYILSTYHNNSTYPMSGTSMAAPHVAGVAGLLLSERPWLSPQEVRAILVSTADPKSFDKYIGSGRLNAHQALLMSTVPLAEIQSPTTYEYLSGRQAITGTAAGPTFQSYSLEYSPSGAPGSWQPIASSSVPVTAGWLADWDVSEIPDGVWLLRLSVTDTGANTSRVYRWVIIDHQLASGWPRSMNSIAHSPLIVDLDGDGSKEIVFTTIHPGLVRVWKADGSSLPGWPVEVGYQVWGSPAVADLTGDDNLEIVIAGANFDLYSPFNPIYALRYDGEPLPGWPQDVGHQVLGTPVIGDLDGDGKQEILASTVADHSGGAQQAMVFAWKVDGSTMPGWPVVIPMAHAETRGPAIGDLTGDGKLEVVVGMADKFVYAWDYQGVLLPGWPQETKPGDIHYGLPQVVLGDVDGDGKLEVVSSAVSTEIRVWDASGALLPGWPVAPVTGYSLGPVALADLTGDGRLEIMAHSNYNRLYAYSSDGLLLPGWPVQVELVYGNSEWPQPAVADVDGDGRLDILWPGTESKVYALQLDGKPVPGWPKQLLAWGTNTPALGDLDGDGWLDMVVPGIEYLYLYHLPSPTGYGQVQWGTYQFNPARTGRFEAEEPPPPPPPPTPDPTPQPPVLTPTPPPEPTPEPQSQLSLYFPLFFKR